MESSTWTFTELVAHANAVLTDRGLPAVDGRTVRFWRTSGAIADPHGAAKGATWGWRHLCQIIAVRAGQAAGQSVAELAASSTDLELTASLAGLPVDEPDGWTPPAPAPTERFWDAPPRETAAASIQTASLAGSGTSYAASAVTPLRAAAHSLGAYVNADATSPVHTSEVTRVDLGPSAVVYLDPAVPSTPELAAAFDALRAALPSTRTPPT